jgi:hypothetical protein
MCQPERSITTMAWAPAAREAAAELVEHRLHGGALTVGRTSATPASRSGQTAPEQIDRLVAQIAQPARPHALLAPAPAQARGLADPRLIPEPDLEPLGLRVLLTPSRSGAALQGDAGDRSWEPAASHAGPASLTPPAAPR